VRLSDRLPGNLEDGVGDIQPNYPAISMISTQLNDYHLAITPGHLVGPLELGTVQADISAGSADRTTERLPGRLVDSF